MRAHRRAQPFAKEPDDFVDRCARRLARGINEFAREHAVWRLPSIWIGSTV